MSNLVSLYEGKGDLEKSQVFQKRVDKHRMRNPHLRFSLARKAFDDRDYDAAIDHLDGLTVWGACRLCVVEVNGSTRLLSACSIAHGAPRAR